MANVCVLPPGWKTQMELKVPGFRLVPALAVVVIWENETVGEISLCVSLLPSFSVTLLSKYINIKKEMFI